MAYKRILTVQDISCLGQCSMTVALPILSACGVETCVLPSAVLSTHTGGFGRPAIRDLTEDIPGICAHWKENGITFDAIYTGYLGSTRQIGLVEEILDTLLAPGGITFVDPAFADHGKLYSGFDGAYVEAMKGLCARADVVIPNVTESCMLTGFSYVEEPTAEEAEARLRAMQALGCCSVVLTGVGKPGMTGTAVLSGEEIHWHSHEKIDKNYHGTGDIFASALVGHMMRGRSLQAAAAAAGEFTKRCIRNTYEDPAHWYGVKFETALPELIRSLEP